MSTHWLTPFLLPSFLVYLVAVSVMFSATRVEAAEKFKLGIVKCLSDLTSAPFSPDVLREKGVDVDAMTFKTQQTSTNELEIQVQINGKYAGLIEASRDPSDEQPLYRSTMIDLNTDLQGKGMATMLYLILAKTLRDQGAGLRSDFGHSDDSIAFWRRFVSQGLADETRQYDESRTLTEKYFVMRDQAIDHAASTVYPFYIERLQKP